MTEVGRTVGVEEEYHLVDARTGELADAPGVADTAVELLGDCAQREISTSQLEVVTPICHELAQVRVELVRLRQGAAQAAAAHGCAVLAAGTHPLAGWREQGLSEGDRYAHLVQRWGLLARQQLITGQHVHVAVPPDLVIPVLDRLRPDLPLLLAMTASSPFWHGEDTGYASYRTIWFARWPVTGTLPLLGTREAYDGLVAGLVSAGVADDASHLYWDARPSVRFPTIEVRVGDTSPLLDEAVLHTALVRALVRTAAVETGELPTPLAEVVRAARWRAARHGLTGTLLDLRTQRLVPAEQAVRSLLARVEHDLRDTDDWEEVSDLVERLLARGTSAERQRAAAGRGGVPAVVHHLLEESAR